jgi:hypothetical protein
MDCDKVPVLERTLYFQDLVRVFGRVLFHSDHQRFRVAREVCVMVAELRANVLVVSLAYFSRRNEAQELRSGFFEIWICVLRMLAHHDLQL